MCPGKCPKADPAFRLRYTPALPYRGRRKFNDSTDRPTACRNVSRNGRLVALPVTNMPVQKILASLPEPRTAARVERQWRWLFLLHHVQVDAAATTGFGGATEIAYGSRGPGRAREEQSHQGRQQQFQRARGFSRDVGGDRPRAYCMDGDAQRFAWIEPAVKLAGERRRSPRSAWAGAKRAARKGGGFRGASGLVRAFSAPCGRADRSFQGCLTTRILERL